MLFRAVSFDSAVETTLVLMGKLNLTGFSDKRFYYAPPSPAASDNGVGQREKEGSEKNTFPQQAGGLGASFGASGLQTRADVPQSLLFLCSADLQQPDSLTADLEQQSGHRRV